MYTGQFCFCLNRRRSQIKSIATARIIPVVVCNQVYRSVHPSKNNINMIYKEKMTALFGFVATVKPHVVFIVRDLMPLTNVIQFKKNQFQKENMPWP